MLSTSDRKSTRESTSTCLSQNLGTISRRHLIAQAHPTRSTPNHSEKYKTVLTLSSNQISAKVSYSHKYSPKLNCTSYANPLASRSHPSSLLSNIHLLLYSKLLLSSHQPQNRGPHIALPSLLENEHKSQP